MLSPEDDHSGLEFESRSYLTRCEQASRAPLRTARIQMAPQIPKQHQPRRVAATHFSIRANRSSTKKPSYYAILP
jgi:hypothetical protein